MPAGTNVIISYATDTKPAAEELTRAQPTMRGNFWCWWVPTVLYALVRSGVAEEIARAAEEQKRAEAGHRRRHKR
jgi:hypothetical protein